MTMPTAWVGGDDDGRFSAYVDYAEPRPFCFMHGPEDVTAAEAVEWARTQTNRVIVRVGNEHYSAGAEPVGGFPQWPSSGEDRCSEQTPGPTVDWTVEAHTGWRREDRKEVAGLLAELTGRNSQAANAVAKLDTYGFGITFTVSARSALDANGTASQVLRDAWVASGIEAVPGEDFDASSIDIYPPGTQPGRGWA